MSYTLILNAGTASPLNLVVQSAAENAPTEVGTVTPSANGADRSTVRGVKRNFGSLTSLVSTADKDAIINLLKWGRQIPCSGDLLGNIQTQCTVRYTGAPMKAGLADFWEVGLALNEVQPGVTLLRYSPGDTITGESFSRSTTATYINGNLVVAVAPINEKRDNHKPGADVSVRALLLEDARTNKVPYSDGWASWSDTGVTIGATTTDPYGGSTAPLLTDAAGNNARWIAVSLTGDGTKSVSMFVKKNGNNVPMVGLYDATAAVFRHRVTITWGGSGEPIVATETGAGTILSYRALTGGWFLIRFTANSAVAANSNRLYFYPSQTSPGSTYAMGAQVEDASFPSSYIFTTGAALTRAADSYSLPFTTPPQEMTVYAKFVEGGTINLDSRRLFNIANAGSSAAQFLVYSPAGAYTVYHDPGAVVVTRSPPAAPVIGDTVEVVPRLFGDGSVDITQSINSAASTTSTQSAANPLSTAWSGQLCWLNSVGSLAVGFTALQSFKIVAGARSLAEMRAA